MISKSLQLLVSAYQFYFHTKESHLHLDPNEVETAYTETSSWEKVSIANIKSVVNQISLSLSHVRKTRWVSESNSFQNLIHFHMLWVCYQRDSRRPTRYGFSHLQLVTNQPNFVKLYPHCTYIQIICLSSCLYYHWKPIRLVIRNSSL